jgi:hypothetical protein
MKLAAAGEAAVTQTVQSDLERPLQRVFRQLGDRRRGGHRQWPLHKADGLFGERREPPGKVRAFEPAHRCGKSFLIRWQEIHAL